MNRTQGIEVFIGDLAGHFSMLSVIEGNENDVIVTCPEPSILYRLEFAVPDAYVSVVTSFV